MEMTNFSEKLAVVECSLIISSCIKMSSESHWGVRTCSPPSLCQEIVRVCEVSRFAPQARKALPYIKEEIISILTKDPVCAVFYPDLLLQVEQIEIHKESENTILNQFRIHLESIKSYRWDAVKLLERCISGSCTLAWNELYELIQNFLANLIEVGTSQEFLLKELKAYCDIGVYDDSDSLLTTLKGLLQKKRSFTCWARVGWPNPGKGLQPFLKQGLEIQQNPPDGQKGAEFKFREKISDPKGLLLCGTVRSHDEFSARDMFVRRIAKTFSYVSFYRPRIENLIRGKVVLVNDEDIGIGSCLSSSPSYAIPLFDARDLGQRVHKILKSRDRLGQQDKMRLDASFQYHSLALSSSLPESQLINLWISLESLVEHEGQSIVDSVSSHVSTLSALSYIQRSMHILARDMVKVEGYKESLLPIIPGSSTYEIPPLSLLSILCQQKEDNYLAILDCIENYPELCRRLQFFRSSVLSSPKNCHARLLLVKKRVDWQVRRIYRIRNEIAHRGQANASLPTLLSHLFAYQSTVLRTLMRDVRRHGAGDWSIEQCVFFRQTVWVALSKMLTKRSSKLTIDGLIDPAESMHKGELILRWQEGEKEKRG
jgi:hypothetical protein